MTLAISMILGLVALATGAGWLIAARDIAAEREARREATARALEAINGRADAARRGWVTRRERLRREAAEKVAADVAAINADAQTRRVAT
jgi:hypothetical protein